VVSQQAPELEATQSGPTATFRQSYELDTGELAAIQRAATLDNPLSRMKIGLAKATLQLIPRHKVNCQTAIPLCCRERSRSA
jgi:hypothetical protein